MDALTAQNSRNMSLLIKGEIRKVKRLKHATTVTIGTAANDAETIETLGRLEGKLVSAYLSTDEITEAEQEAVDNEPVSQWDASRPASPGQRLRAVLFRVWESQGGYGMTSEAYYQQEMSKITGHYLQFLPEHQKQ